MKLYNFTRLITKYSTKFTVYHSKGEYKAGIWQETKDEETEFTGAIVPMPERKVYTSGGAYTSQDRQLYMLTRIPEGLRNGHVNYNGNTYSIEEETEYSEYSDVYIYYLKRVNTNDKQ